METKLPKMRHDEANELQRTLVVAVAVPVAAAVAVVVRNLHNFIAYILGAGIMSLDILF